MPQNTLIVTSPRNPAPKWPEGFVAVLRDAGAQEKNIPYCQKFRGIALSPRNCLPTDDFAVSVHSTHEPVLKIRPPNTLTQKDNPTTKAVYTRPFGDVNTKVDEKPSPINRRISIEASLEKR